ncbi:MAG TPA: ATP-binding protein [Chitinophagaceae bacterium]|jgi:signal transduction histidine kinase
MSIEPLIAFFFIRHVKRKLDTPELHAKWDKKLKITMITIVVLFVLQLVSNLETSFNWLWHALSVYILYTVYKEKEFQHARSLTLAILPVIIISILLDTVRLFPDSISEPLTAYLGFAFPFSIVWMVYMVIVSNRQQKALEKEKKKRQEEEAQHRIIATRKSELEEMVNQRTAEIMQQKNELEHALEELKATQTQLIQSEKMASLGELTAGIAHEIQNPLNFVNNFSEVNKELIEELEGERSKLNGKRNEELENEILNDVKQNLEKIIHHGKRADAIVKSMLQHSRVSTGQKERVDINVLVDEYLRLSYHGIRAKDKTFNATLQTDFDTSLEKINIVPQDMGRVLLNLFNNAFFAVSKPPNPPMAEEHYEPTVKVSTKKAGDKVEIKVADNGVGISQKIVDKIFQPFFTTKPTGQGTGLGLSLSYDIIKAHGGEINVETKEGEGSEFIIQLPIV